MPRSVLATNQLDCAQISEAVRTGVYTYGLLDTAKTVLLWLPAPAFGDRWVALDFTTKGRRD